jgi:NAD+ diphosphatase
VTQRFVSLLAPSEPTERAWWFLFWGDQLYVRDLSEGTAVPFLRDPAEIGIQPDRIVYLGTLDGIDCYAASVEGELAERTPDPGHRHSGIRGLYGVLDDETFGVAGRAFQLLEWDRTHRYCGVCASPTEPVAGERARRCPACGHLHFPRISPVIIVRVERGSEILLARGPSFPDGVFSVLAGFVEPGETLEQAVAREVREEVGVELEGIRYFGSQPWPFPHSLMIGFTARHAGGEIRVDGQEIVHADWFPIDRLPKLPSRLSIARRLVDDFLASHGG